MNPTTIAPINHNLVHALAWRLGGACALVIMTACGAVQEDTTPDVSCDASTSGASSSASSSSGGIPVPLPDPLRVPLDCRQWEFGAALRGPYLAPDGTVRFTDKALPMPGDVLRQAIDIPDGALITGINVMIDPADRPSLDDVTKPMLALGVSNMNGLEPRLLAATRDSVDATETYNQQHGLELQCLSAVVAKSSYSLYAEYRHESGGGAAQGALSAIVVLYRIDD